MDKCEHGMSKHHCELCLRTIADTLEFERQCVLNTIENPDPRCDNGSKITSLGISLCRTIKSVLQLEATLADIVFQRDQMRFSLSESEERISRGEGRLDAGPDLEQG